MANEAREEEARILEDSHVINDREKWSAISHEAILKCTHIIIFAGAGMSVDSGIPDYRGPDGIWRKIEAEIARTGHSAKETTPHWFRTSPKDAWSYWIKNYKTYRDATPHIGYAKLLAKCKELGSDKAFVVTSNVDGQFQKAGFENVLEIHGSMHRLQKIRPLQNKDTEIINTAEIIKPDDTSNKIPEELLEGVWRPNVYMFDDKNWNSKVKLEQEKLYDSWMCKLFATPDAKPLVIEIGSGQVVMNLRNRTKECVVSIDKARDMFKAWFFRVNPQEPEVSGTFGRDFTVVGIPTSAVDFLYSMCGGETGEGVAREDSKKSTLDDLDEFV